MKRERREGGKRKEKRRGKEQFHTVFYSAICHPK
jgi:hypothetical protein